MNNKLSIAFLIFGLVIYNVWPLIGAQFFYCGLHVLFVIAALGFYNSTDLFARRLAFVAVVTNVSSLLDDLFNWQSATWNEYIIVIVAFVATYTKYLNERFQYKRGSTGFIR